VTYRFLGKCGRSEMKNIEFGRNPIRGYLNVQWETQGIPRHLSTITRLCKKETGVLHSIQNLSPCATMDLSNRRYKISFSSAFILNQPKKSRESNPSGGDSYFNAVFVFICVLRVLYLQILEYLMTYFIPCAVCTTGRESKHHHLPLPCPAALRMQSKIKRKLGIKKFALLRH
jgi:hypothetical protein